MQSGRALECFGPTHGGCTLYQCHQGEIR